MNIQEFFDWLSSLPLVQPFTTNTHCPLEAFVRSQGATDIYICYRDISIDGQAWPHSEWTTAFMRFADQKPWSELTPVEAITFLIGYDSNLLRKEGMGQHLDNTATSPTFA